MEMKRYVLQNEMGEFYWKGEASSSHGFKKEFKNAFLFKSLSGIEKRRKLFPNTIIREVTVILGDEIQNL